jgi:hypothetical protein
MYIKLTCSLADTSFAFQKVNISLVVLIDRNYNLEFQ